MKKAKEYICLLGGAAVAVIASLNGASADYYAAREFEMLKQPNAPAVSLNVTVGKEATFGETEVTLGLPFDSHGLLALDTKVAPNLKVQDEKLTAEAHKGLAISMGDGFAYIGGIASLGMHSERSHENPGVFDYGFGGEFSIALGLEPVTLSLRGDYRGLKSWDPVCGVIGNEQSINAAVRANTGYFQGEVRFNESRENGASSQELELEAMVRVYRDLVFGGTIGSRGASIMGGISNSDVTFLLGVGEEGFKLEADVKIPNKTISHY